MFFASESSPCLEKCYQLKEIQDLGYNKGKAEGKIESITKLMRNLDLSPEKAMKALEIAPSEFSRYLALL